VQSRIKITRKYAMQQMNTAEDERRGKEEVEEAEIDGNERG
jgi:hypothetical protein